MSRRDAILGGAALALCGCRSERDHPLAADEPVDDSFRGCQASCSTKPPAGAVLVLQPNAKVGDYTRCPVSGAVFHVGEASPKRAYGDRVVFLCCDACARYFDRHADAVVAARGI